MAPAPREIHDKSSLCGHMLEAAAESDVVASEKEIGIGHGLELERVVGRVLQEHGPLFARLTLCVGGGSDMVRLRVWARMRSDSSCVQIKHRGMPVPIDLEALLRGNHKSDAMIR